MLELLARGSRETRELLGGLDERRANHRYAPGKWSVKEVLGHVTDCERVFAYRALCIARGDETPLPSFDQDSYVARAGSERRALAELLAEFEGVRASSLSLFRSLDGEAWERRGTASGIPVVACAFPWIIAGHELHHRRVLAERYL